MNRGIEESRNRGIEESRNIFRGKKHRETNKCIMLSRIDKWTALFFVEHRFNKLINQNTTKLLGCCV
jgi:hypothetical protein